MINARRQLKFLVINVSVHGLIIEARTVLFFPNNHYFLER